MTSLLFRRTHTSKRESRSHHPASRTKPDGRGPRRRAGRRGPLFLLLLLAIISLSLIGLVMVLSASSVTALQTYDDSWYFFRRQLLWMGVGGAAMAVTSNINYRFWARLATPTLVVSFTLLLLVLIPGVGRQLNGSSRWLAVGPLSFQPSEVVKFALVVFVAELLSRPGRPISNTRLTINPVLLVLGLASLLLLLEPDLGTAIILGFIVMMMLVAAGTSAIHLAMLGTAGALLVSLAAASSGYRRRRVFAFLDPWADPLDTGFQNLQSLVSVANGGITGVGLGASRGKWGFLPYAHNDFIFAILAEEMGLVGGVFVVLAFTAIGAIGLIAASRVRDRFGSLLAVGITTWIVSQAFINIGVVIGALPTTGVTLPLISLGGTSLIFTLAACGVLLNITRHA